MRKLKFSGKKIGKITKNIFLKTFLRKIKPTIQIPSRKFLIVWKKLIEIKKNLFICQLLGLQSKKFQLIVVLSLYKIRLTK